MHPFFKMENETELQTSADLLSSWTRDCAEMLETPMAEVKHQKSQKYSTLNP
jgi:hypothetical protein